MMKIAFAVTAAAAVLMTVPLLVGTSPIKVQNLRMAQGVDVQLGRNRDDRDRGRRHDSDVTNIGDRSIEHDLLPWCEQHSMPVQQ
jgi:hypothetical protein